jgi:Integrase core domain
VLDVELFYTLAEAKVILADWLTAYNTEHPHSALGMQPPARFAERWREENAAPTPHSDRPTGSLREAPVDPATVQVDTHQELSLRVDQ